VISILLFAIYFASRNFSRITIIHAKLLIPSQEMEYVFGDFPPDGLPSSVSNSPAKDEPHVSSRNIGEVTNSITIMYHSYPQ
jgi:hypothetical protein